jgi:predicted phage baseplate assembly protein
MSCDGNSNCTCGCCLGIAVQTPQGEINLPGQSALAYRTGRWATFKDSMLARLSSSDYPALQGLKTRDDDDFSIALMDASAVVLDILTFYQERLANESYLRTATQLYSLTQLCQLIGYQPSPGVSASVYLAFNLSAAPGLPTNPNTTAITIPAGTTAQSVPAQGQKPQAFQTSADIVGKPDWNALPVQTGTPWLPESRQTSVYLDGTATQLLPGDAFLIVGDERVGHPGNPNWDVRLVSTVQPDAVNQRTLVTWVDPLGSGSVSPAQKHPKFYALRQRATLYGYNAINPLMLSKQTVKTLKAEPLPGSSETVVDTGAFSSLDWVFGWDVVNRVSLASEKLVDLDSVYGKITPGSWLALINPDTDTTRTPAGYISLYQIKSTTTTTRSEYGMSAKITRLATDTSYLLSFYYSVTRVASAFAQSEELAVAEQPLDHPLYGTLLDLEGVRDDLVGITAVAITGKNQKMTVNANAKLKFEPYDKSGSVTLNPGDVLTVLQPPNVFHKDGSIPSWTTSKSTITLVVADASGRSGTVKAALSEFTLALAAKSDPVVQEFALVTSIATVNATNTTVAQTRIVLKNPLLNCYDRTVTTVNANVGIATAGSPVTELLGNGSAATPGQSFTLKQSPLTYVQAATPSGSLSSLDVKANGASWTEVPTLYNQAPTAQVFETMNLVGGKALVQFGDGVEGATLPTGQNNIIANFRVGIGSAGNVAAGSITTLVDRPVGVNGVNNPMAATGGQDAQSIDDIRTNAPQTVFTLGRAVSITDYQNFAATFAGIAKAYAIWIPNGVNRGVFVTVAATGGVQLSPGNLTLGNLTNALLDYGNPNVNVQVQSFYETLFGLNADIAYDPKYDAKAVEATVLAMLTSTYSFASRTFGQGVSSDEIDALIQGVPGVLAVNVTSLTLGPTSAAGDLGSVGYSVAAWNNWIAQKQTVTRPKSGSPKRICPYIPVAAIKKLPAPAEILVLNPDPTTVTLGVMA